MAQVNIVYSHNGIKYNNIQSVEVEDPINQYEVVTLDNMIMKYKNRGAKKTNLTVMVPEGTEYDSKLLALSVSDSGGAGDRIVRLLTTINENDPGKTKQTLQEYIVAHVNPRKPGNILTKDAEGILYATYKIACARLDPKIL